MQKLDIIVSGRVQGVGFRRFVEKKANLYNIAGWVKNNSDGTVSIEACAEIAAMQLFITAVEKGGVFSRVDNLNIENREDVSEYPSSFKVSF